jgi:hypothetical protein
VAIQKQYCGSPVTGQVSRLSGAPKKGPNVAGDWPCTTAHADLRRLLKASKKAASTGAKPLIEQLFQPDDKKMAILDSRKPTQYGPRGLKGGGKFGLQ